MNRLFTVAYPSLDAVDSAFIDAFRRQHDPKVDVIAAHFTLVFGCAEVEHAEYLRHVEIAARESRTIRFCCRYAMLGADDEDDTAYVFLVPDEGFAQISLLHDRLYAGPLASRLRLDLPYIPHVTVGALGSRGEAKALCDELNHHGVEIHGAIDAVSVGSLDKNGFQNHATYNLLA